MPEDMPGRMPEDMPDRMPDGMPEDMPEHLPEDMPGRMPEDMPDRMPDGMPEDMPEHLPEDMPGRMPEAMPDRMPEDLPVAKRIDDMVGITRSKVIFIRVPPNSKFKKPWCIIKKTMFSMLKSIRFPFKIQVTYFQKLDFEASP